MNRDRPDRDPDRYAMIAAFDLDMRLFVSDGDRLGMVGCRLASRAVLSVRPVVLPAGCDYWLSRPGP
jgi:hypothetical protein